MKNNFNTLSLFFLFIFCQNFVQAQDLSGTWDGRFSLKNSPRNWSFEIELQQDHSAIKGIGKQIELSKRTDSKSFNSSFTIEGNFNGQSLVYDMKEVLTSKSPNGQCLSHCEYVLLETPTKYQFIGSCNRNGIFYKNDQYIEGYSACENPATVQVIFEKTKDLKGRKTEVVESIYANDSKVTIQIWDNNKVDGDVVSLNLNGTWVLENYKLTDEVKTIVLDLSEASNELILHAENLGTLPPNTAAISIWSGKKKLKNLVLNSDKGRSEGVRIFR